MLMVPPGAPVCPLLPSPPPPPPAAKYLSDARNTASVLDPNQGLTGGLSPSEAIYAAKCRQSVRTQQWRTHALSQCAVPIVKCWHSGGGCHERLTSMPACSRPAHSQADCQQAQLSSAPLTSAQLPAHAVPPSIRRVA